MKLSDYLVPGKTTVFDFYSEYCPPCRAISPRLEKLHATRDDIAVVKVDINRPDIKGIDWQSPVAKEFGLESIPHFKIYGPDGKLKAEGDPAYEMVMELAPITGSAPFLTTRSAGRAAGGDLFPGGPSPFGVAPTSRSTGHAGA